MGVKTVAELRPATRPQPIIARTSIPAGNAAQIGGAILGAALLQASGSTRHDALVRATSMVGGWLAIYLSTHAFAHWVVGRVCGIEFRGYRILLGTANPEQYPRLMRPVMNRLPFWSITTARDSQRADPWARAAMFAAGDTGSSLANLLVAAYVVRRNVPAGRIAAVVLIVWTVVKTVATTRNERGDYAKALRAVGRR